MRDRGRERDIEVEREREREREGGTLLLSNGVLSTIQVASPTVLPKVESIDACRNVMMMLCGAT